MIFELGMFENKIDRIANRSVKRDFSISSEWLKKGPDPSFKNLLAWCDTGTSILQKWL